MPLSRMVFVALLVTATAGFPQTPASLGDALAKLQSDPAAAAKIAQEVVTREPKNARAWRVLGMASLRAKQPDGTIDFLITSAWSGVHGFHSGRVFIISSGVRG